MNLRRLKFRLFRYHSPSDHWRFTCWCKEFGPKAGEVFWAEVRAALIPNGGDN